MARSLPIVGTGRAARGSNIFSVAPHRVKVFSLWAATIAVFVAIFGGLALTRSPCRARPLGELRCREPRSRPSLHVAAVSGRISGEGTSALTHRLRSPNCPGLSGEDPLATRWATRNAGTLLRGQMARKKGYEWNAGDRRGGRVAAAIHLLVSKGHWLAVLASSVSARDGSALRRSSCSASTFQAAAQLRASSAMIVDQ